MALSKIFTVQARHIFPYKKKLHRGASEDGNNLSVHTKVTYEDI